MKETTVKRLKNLYHQELLTKPLELGDDIVPELVPMKRGRPLLIGDELDRQVREYILDTRRVGGDINTAVVIAGGTGIMMSQKEPFTIKRYERWKVDNMEFAKRKATTKAKINVQDFEEIKNCFYLM